MPDVIRAYAYPSSHGSTTYEVLEYDEPLEPGMEITRWSCNCPGWTFKRSGAVRRTCKHVKMAMQGEFAAGARPSPHPYGVRPVSTPPTSAVAVGRIGERRVVGGDR